MLETIPFSNDDLKLKLLKLRDDIRSSLTYSKNNIDRVQICYVTVEILSFKDGLFCLSYTPFVKHLGFLQEQSFHFTATTIPSNNILDTLVQLQFPELFI